MSKNGRHDTSKTDTKLTTGTSRRGFLAATGATTALLGTGQVAANSSVPENPGRPGNRVICYYPWWSSGVGYPPEDIPFDRITSLNWAFLEPKSDGTVVLGDSDPEDIKAVSNYSDERTDLLFSISGGWYPEEYSEAASKEQARQRFAETAVDHVIEYGFDGIDLDWEYPDGSTSEDDPENFVKLVRAVREELDSRVHPRAPLTAAVSPAPSVADDAYLDDLFEYLSWLHVMFYDYHGGWSTYTNFNAPLYSGPDDPYGTDWNVASHTEYWLGRDVESDDVVMGIPFYGRVFQGVVDTGNNGLYQPFARATAVTYESVEEDRESQLYDYYWHAESKAPWLWDSASRFITYDNADSVGIKMDFAKDRDLGGAFCWELSQDPSDTLISVMHDKLR
jgi:chitinase